MNHNAVTKSTICSSNYPAIYSEAIYTQQR